MLWHYYLTAMCLSVQKNLNVLVGKTHNTTFSANLLEPTYPIIQTFSTVFDPDSFVIFSFSFPFPTFLLKCINDSLF